MSHFVTEAEALKILELRDAGLSIQRIVERIAEEGFPRRGTATVRGVIARGGAPEVYRAAEKCTDQSPNSFEDRFFEEVAGEYVRARAAAMRPTADAPPRVLRAGDWPDPPVRSTAAAEGWF